MSSVKWRGIGVLALGLALSSTLGGCGNGAPRLGGVAAEAAGQTIVVEEVDVLTDALCASNEATGDARYTRPRSSMQNNLVGALVQVAVIDELGLAEDARNTVDTSQVPGWAEMSDEEQRELTEFLDGNARLRAALEQLSDPSSESPQEATESGLAALAERATEEGVEVTINPRYGLSFADGNLAGAQEVSTAVSDTATARDEADAAYLSSLPEAQLCGVRPEAGAAR